MVRQKVIANQILQLAITGVLKIEQPDSTSPEIWSHRANRKPRRISVRKMIKNHRRQPRPFTEIRIDAETKITICYARLIWIVAHKATIPAGYEIHHIDEDWNNNAVNNLICVHPADHSKLHFKDVANVF